VQDADRRALDACSAASTAARPGRRAVVDGVRRRLRLGGGRCLGHRLTADPLAEAGWATPGSFSAATLAAAATIDILIPPSIPLILFALSNTSMARCSTPASCRA
jgi:hypothetical protein